MRKQQSNDITRYVHFVAHMDLRFWLLPCFRALSRCSVHKNHIAILFRLIVAEIEALHELVREPLPNVHRISTALNGVVANECTRQLTKMLRSMYLHDVNLFVGRGFVRNLLLAFLPHDLQVCQLSRRNHLHMRHHKFSATVFKRGSPARHERLLGCVRTCTKAEVAGSIKREMSSSDKRRRAAGDTASIAPNKSAACKSTSQFGKSDASLFKVRSHRSQCSFHRLSSQSQVPSTHFDTPTLQPVLFDAPPTTQERSQVRAATEIVYVSSNFHAGRSRGTHSPSVNEK